MSNQNDNFSDPQPITEGSKLAIVGGLGFTVILCLLLLVGGSIFLIRRAQQDEPEQALNEASMEASNESDETEASSSGIFGGPSTKKDTADQQETRPAQDENGPQMSPPQFALKLSPQGEPLEPGFAFAPGVSQLHAVFDYTNLSPNQMWTQVWYHNGDEVSQSSQPWLAGEAGVYDYLIEAGGSPLPSGQWALEFYIDDQLLSAGSFTIGDDGRAAAVEPAATPDILKIYPLAYTKWDGEKHNLFIGDSIGSQEQYLLGRAAGPAWSPDGRYLFFYGEQGVDQQVIAGKVYPLPGATNGLIRINASPPPASIHQVQIYQGTGWNDGSARSANISPDGSMIAYDGDRGGGRRVYFLGTEANQQFHIEIIGEQADWSPDSQQIVYRSGRFNQNGIWISNRNDTGHVRITTGGNDSFPSWSPDGQTIAFSREEGGNVDIYTVKVDGSELTRLTDTPGHDTLPLYLPNGDLLFRSTRTGSWGIWKMKGDGSDQVEIISNAPVGPDWSYSRMSAFR